MATHGTGATAADMLGRHAGSQKHQRQPHGLDRPTRALRSIIAAARCIYPASVFDPISARIAEDLGFEAGNGRKISSTPALPGDDTCGGCAAAPTWLQTVD
jgi:hypothetical protein